MSVTVNALMLRHLVPLYIATYPIYVALLTEIQKYMNKFAYRDALGLSVERILNRSLSIREPDLNRVRGLHLRHQKRDKQTK